MDEEKTIPMTQEEDGQSGYFFGLRFNDIGKSYFFSTSESDWKIGDPVVVETIRGIELGKVATLPLPLAEYHLQLELKPIVRRASLDDVTVYQDNLEKAKTAYQICLQEIKDKELDMNLISAEYTLDRAKIIFSYLANERVDFRDLLKSLASRLRCRIELRQVGTRDKAKVIGGIGICGLPLCCATFLNEFDGISISRAKNQLLALNIPKLSGHCGKLICCLKYEDDNYSELRKDYPKVGLKVIFNHETYRVTSMNVLSRTIKLERSGDVQFISLDEFLKLSPLEEKRDDHHKENHQ